VLAQFRDVIQYWQFWNAFHRYKFVDYMPSNILIGMFRSRILIQSESNINMNISANENKFGVGEWKIHLNSQMKSKALAIFNQIASLIVAQQISADINGLSFHRQMQKKESFTISMWTNETNPKIDLKNILFSNNIVSIDACIRKSLVFLPFRVYSNMYSNFGLNSLQKTTTSSSNNNNILKSSLSTTHTTTTIDDKKEEEEEEENISNAEPAVIISTQIKNKMQTRSRLQTQNQTRTTTMAMAMEQKEEETQSSYNNTNINNNKQEKQIQKQSPAAAALNKKKTNLVSHHTMNLNNIRLSANSKKILRNSNLNDKKNQAMRCLISKLKAIEDESKEEELQITTTTMTATNQRKVGVQQQQQRMIRSRKDCSYTMNEMNRFSQLEIAQMLSVMDNKVLTDILQKYSHQRLLHEMPVHPMMSPHSNVHHSNHVHIHGNAFGYSSGVNSNISGSNVNNNNNMMMAMPEHGSGRSSPCGSPALVSVSSAAATLEPILEEVDYGIHSELTLPSIPLAITHNNNPHHTPRKANHFTFPHQTSGVTAVVPKIMKYQLMSSGTSSAAHAHAHAQMQDPQQPITHVMPADIQAIINQVHGLPAPASSVQMQSQMATAVVPTPTSMSAEAPNMAQTHTHTRTHPHFQHSAHNTHCPIDHNISNNNISSAQNNSEFSQHMHHHHQQQQPPMYDYSKLKKVLFAENSELFDLFVVSSEKCLGDLANILKQEGCPICLYPFFKSPYAKSDAAVADDEHITDEEISLQQHITNSYIIIRCRLLQCQHVIHLECLCNARNSILMRHTHCSSFFQILRNVNPNTNADAFRKVFPETNTVTGKKYFISFQINHLLSEQFLLSDQWPKSIESFIDTECVEQRECLQLFFQHTYLHLWRGRIKLAVMEAAASASSNNKDNNSITNTNNTNANKDNSNNNSSNGVHITTSVESGSNLNVSVISKSSSSSLQSETNNSSINDDGRETLWIHDVNYEILLPIKKENDNNSSGDDSEDDNSNTQIIQLTFEDERTKNAFIVSLNIEAIPQPRIEILSLRYEFAAITLNDNHRNAANNANNNNNSNQQRDGRELQIMRSPQNSLHFHYTGRHHNDNHNQHRNSNNHHQHHQHHNHRHHNNNSNHHNNNMQLVPSVSNSSVHSLPLVRHSHHIHHHHNTANNHQLSSNFNYQQCQQNIQQNELCHGIVTDHSQMQSMDYHNNNNNNQHINNIQQAQVQPPPPPPAVPSHAPPPAPVSTAVALPTVIAHNNNNNQVQTLSQAQARASSLQLPLTAVYTNPYLLNYVHPQLLQHLLPVSVPAAMGPVIQQQAQNINQYLAAAAAQNTLNHALLENLSRLSIENANTLQHIHHSQQQASHNSSSNSHNNNIHHHHHHHNNNNRQNDNNNNQYNNNNRNNNNNGDQQHQSSNNQHPRASNNNSSNNSNSGSSAGGTSHTSNTYSQSNEVHGNQSLISMPNMDMHLHTNGQNANVNVNMNMNMHMNIISNHNSNTNHNNNANANNNGGERQHESNNNNNNSNNNGNNQHNNSRNNNAHHNNNNNNNNKRRSKSHNHNHHHRHRNHNNNNNNGRHNHNSNNHNQHNNNNNNNNNSGNNHGNGNGNNDNMRNNHPPHPPHPSTDIILNRNISIANTHELSSQSLYHFACTKVGSRYLCTKMAHPNFFRSFYPKLKPNFARLMVHQFGHFVCRAIYQNPLCSRLSILKHAIVPYFDQIACNKQGSFALLCIMNLMTTVDEIQCITEGYQYQKFAYLNRDQNSQVSSTYDLQQIVLHPSGYHVTQRFLRFGFPHFDCILDNIKLHFVLYATDHYGVPVIKSILDMVANALPEIQSQYWDYLMAFSVHTNTLVVNQYGNYVIQHLMDISPLNIRDNIKQLMIGHYGKYSKQKFSSNVVEKCLRQSLTPIELKILSDTEFDNNRTEKTGDINNGNNNDHNKNKNSNSDNINECDEKKNSESMKKNGDENIRHISSRREYKRKSNKGNNNSVRSSNSKLYANNNNDNSNSNSNSNSNGDNSNYSHNSHGIHNIEQKKYLIDGHLSVAAAIAEFEKNEPRLERKSRRKWKYVIVRELLSHSKELISHKFGNYCLQTALNVSSTEKILLNEFLGTIEQHLYILRPNIRHKWTQLCNVADANQQLFV
jgi:hypothetical protein